MNKVLVVEDEPAICALLSDALEDENFETHYVHSDQEAFALLRRDPAFGCMVVDVNLGPGTTGYDVARFARQIDPQLPVIYVSGQITRVSFEANGVKDSVFLAKPFLLSELFQLVHMLVGDNAA